MTTKRRLVLLLDGTWNTNDKGTEPTNVVKLLRSIPSRDRHGISQILYYGRGVGTGEGDKYRGGLAGMGLSRNLTDAYRFLANNYLPGDEIHIFGFSRGAYTARSLAGLIGVAGLLHKNALGRKLTLVMDQYRTRHDKNSPTNNTRLKKEAIAKIAGPDRYPDVPVKCVGVWDTVGSLGIPGDWSRNELFASRWYFHDVHIGPHIEVGLHALAIDEKRSAFAPTLWTRTEGEIQPAHVEQVWFPGVHANIGGSYPDNKLSDITLDWMIKRVTALTNLEVNTSTLSRQPITDCIDGRGIESRKFQYGVLMLNYPYPYLRTISGVETPAQGKLDSLLRDTIGFGNSRRNSPEDGDETINECLHISALERWRLDAVEHDAPVNGTVTPIPYRPPNLVALVKYMQSHGNAGISVVGWDGELIPAGPLL